MVSLNDSSTRLQPVPKHFSDSPGLFIGASANDFGYTLLKKTQDGTLIPDVDQVQKSFPYFGFLWYMGARIIAERFVYQICNI